ncbi:hypothetical protein HD554DRAFT_2277544 [Boletus coccyginus]|nr:hypothetical protein HD554DRAFT_2277544 [Boletus coccyginus]
MDPLEGSINHQINTLYFLDSLCDVFVYKSAPTAAGRDIFTCQVIEYGFRDLRQIIDGQQVDEVVQALSSRQTNPRHRWSLYPFLPLPRAARSSRMPKGTVNGTDDFGSGDVLKPSPKSCVMAINPKPIPLRQAQDLGVCKLYRLCTFQLAPTERNENAELGLDIKFENEWKATSDPNEDDVEALM